MFNFNSFTFLTRGLCCLTYFNTCLISVHLLFLLVVCAAPQLQACCGCRHCGCLGCGSGRWVARLRGCCHRTGWRAGRGWVAGGRRGWGSVVRRGWGWVAVAGTTLVALGHSCCNRGGGNKLQSLWLWKKPSLTFIVIKKVIMRPIQLKACNLI